MTDVSANAETRKVLRDLLRELEAPTALRAARRWAEQHAPDHRVLWALLDEAERPQRLAFEGLVMEALEHGIYPSADALDRVQVVRSLRASRPDMTETACWILAHNERASGLTLSGDQARWRNALLERLGWRRKRAGHGSALTVRWIPPARTA